VSGIGTSSKTSMRMETRPRPRLAIHRPNRAAESAGSKTRVRRRLGSLKIASTPLPAALVCPGIGRLLCAGLFSADRITLVQSSPRFRSRRCMNFANAIRPKMNRHSTTNTTMLFVGVGRFSGKRAVGSMGGCLQ
jgi:hypothetical protein